MVTCATCKDTSGCMTGMGYENACLPYSPNWICPECSKKAGIPIAVSNHFQGYAYKTEHILSIRSRRGPLGVAGHQ